MANTVASTLSFSYNAGGDLLSASDADSSNTFLYTPRGLLKSDFQQLTSTITATINNKSYDALGRRTQFQVKLGNVVDSTVDYGYSPDGIETTIKQSGTKVANKSVKYTRDAAGRLSQLKRYADLNNTEPVAWTDFVSDSVNGVTLDRTKSITHRFETTILDQFNLTWDAANRLKSVDATNDGTSTFQYDLINQLVVAD